MMMAADSIVPELKSETISAVVQIVPHQSMTVRQPTMTAAAWTVRELKAGMPSAVVLITRPLTITRMLRLMTAAVLIVGWIQAFHLFYRGREDMILFDHPIAAIRYAVPMVRLCSLRSMSEGMRFGAKPIPK